MKLCYIGDPRSVHTQRWVRWFAAEHDVIFIATAPDDALSELRVCTLPTTSARRGLRLVNSVRLVRRVLADHQPDVVHGHFLNEAGWFAAAARFRPFVVSAWGSDLYRAPAESRLARRLNPWVVRSADWVTCDSEHQAELLRSWGAAPERVSVIGWGVDPREFNPGVDGGPLRARLGIPPGASMVLSPRQWIPNSNIPALVAAHALLPDSVHLVLKRMPRFETDGGAPVEAAIAASPARERIHVIGELPAEEIPGLYAAADAVASLCETDGTPVSLLEAMALGRPIVALQNPSVAEWISEPGGRFVSGLDPNRLAAALNGFLADPAARQRAAAHNVGIVASRADRSAEMGRMGHIYGRLAGERMSNGASRGG
jgi:glycosyltransferase involved in cell wall biosynthesis